MFNRSKKYFIRAFFTFLVAVAVSVIMGLVAEGGKVNDYNVMGVTMPPWFYFILALNAVVFLVGIGNIIASIFVFFVEARVAHDDFDSSSESDAVNDGEFNPSSQNEEPRLAVNA